MWIGIAGVTVGVVGALFGRAQLEAWAAQQDCSTTKPAMAASDDWSCPLRFEGGKPVVTDKAELDRLRLALRDGVFRPWVELGRAPTPEEVGERLHLEPKGVAELLGKLETCGETAQAGIRKVPESDLIAVAWPFANVPTGITVTVEGGKPVQARCSVDALGISKMMGRKAVVEAETRDGKAKLRVEVDGDKLVSADPPEAVVFRGGSCDEMLFFSSQAGLDAWKKRQRVTGGKAFTMREGVTHGAELFGQVTAGLPE
ncbi:MAG TPA: organomercurial lyase [Polyangiaceae bacterium]|nr:organomercurial lyase [Polyangiaceae bacterium]